MSIVRTESSVMEKKIEKESGIEKLRADSKNEDKDLQNGQKAAQQSVQRAPQQALKQVEQQAAQQDEFMAAYFRVFQELKQAEAMPVKFYPKIQALRNMTRIYLPSFKK